MIFEAEEMVDDLFKFFDIAASKDCISETCSAVDFMKEQICQF